MKNKNGLKPLTPTGTNNPDNTEILKINNNNTDGNSN